MADADTLLREGDVTGARAALVDIVRSRPGDAQARMFLFQLLSVAGEWDKASAQLNALVQIDSQAQMLAVTYNQAMEGERSRAAVFAGKQPMQLLKGEGTWADGIARSITLLTQGDANGAAAARDEAFDQAPEMPGSVNGRRFEWLADADSRFGPLFEAFLAGRYGLIPFDAISGITSEGPRDLRDTVWYPVQIAFKNGQSAAAFLPARYPGSETSADDAVKLGRMTSWTERDWGQEGAGQRLWMFSEGDDLGLLEIRDLMID